MLEYWWIPVVIIYYIIYAYFSKLNGDTKYLSYFFLLYIMQAMAIWPIVSRYSKNVLIDGMIYDLIIVMVFYGTLIWMGAARPFGWLQWTGLVLMVAGTILIKLGK
jgi:hypothetical protein